MMHATKWLLGLILLQITAPALAKTAPLLPDSENLIANASLADIAAKITVDDDPAAPAISISAEPVTFAKERHRLFGLVKIKFPRQTPSDGAYLFAVVSRKDGAVAVQMRYYSVARGGPPQTVFLSDSAAPGEDETSPVSTVSSQTQFIPGYWMSMGSGTKAWSPPTTITRSVYGINIPLASLAAEGAHYPNDKYHYLPVFLYKPTAVSAPNYKLYPSEAAAFLKIVNDLRAKVMAGK